MRGTIGGEGGGGGGGGGKGNVGVRMRGFLSSRVHSMRAGKPNVQVLSRNDRPSRGETGQGGSSHSQAKGGMGKGGREGAVGHKAQLLWNKAVGTPGWGWGWGGEAGED